MFAQSQEINTTLKKLLTDTTSEELDITIIFISDVLNAFDDLCPSVKFIIFVKC